jgi:signal transduction histidine kinase/ActR/RegA family two-component response regulator
MIALTAVCGIAVLLSSILLFTIEIEDAMHVKSEVAEKILKHEIERMKSAALITVTGMANSDELKEAIINNDRQQVAYIAETYQAIAQVGFMMITDKDGYVITRTHDPSVYGDNISYLPQVISAFDRKTEVNINSGPVIRLGVSTSTPILDGSHNIIGVVSMGFRLDSLDFVKNLKELTGCEITIFLGDVNVASTIRHLSGEYTLGTVAAPHVSGPVLAGETYVGRINLFGRNVFARYFPLYGPNDEIIGMMFAGSYTEDETRKIVVFIATGAMITLLVLLVCLFIANLLSEAIDNRLSDVMDELRKASQAKGDFLANMSHEMRTPLNAITGMTIVGKKTQDINEKNNALEKIEDASSHLLGLISDILDMAKIEANKLELYPVTFSIEKMVQQVLSVTQFRANEKQQTIVTDIDPRLPRNIVGDDKRLSQVIVNLLSNAIKFTGAGGEIKLAVSLDKRTNKSIRLRIEVEDNGIGISPEHRERLFGVFEQAKSGTSREYGGTGLGLAITKRIIDIMGGEITVESVLNEGSKFIVTVPMGRYDEKNKTPRQSKIRHVNNPYADTTKFTGKNILVVEDVEINRDIVVAMLGDTGLSIDCAENGEEALEKVTADPGRYDLIFMDLQMPQMDGFEATKRIRAILSESSGRTTYLPIVAMTAHVFKEDIDACLEAGMDGHCGKPLDVEKLMEVLQKHIGG